MNNDQLENKWQMYTSAGNRACEMAAKRLLRKAGSLNDRKLLMDTFREEMDKVAVKHDEVWDTEPRNEFYDLRDKIANLHDIEVY